MGHPDDRVKCAIIIDFLDDASKIWELLVAVEEIYYLGRFISPFFIWFGEAILNFVFVKCFLYPLDGWLFVW